MTEDSNEDIIRDNMRKIVMGRIGGEIEVEYKELAEFDVTKPESQRLMSVIFPDWSLYLCRSAPQRADPAR